MTIDDIDAYRCPCPDEEQTVGTALSVGAPPLDDPETSAVLVALADPVRIRILGILASEGARCPCHLVGPLELSQPTVSHHLKQLRDQGLVVGEQRGRFTYYQLVPEGLERLGLSLLDLAASAREMMT